MNAPASARDSTGAKEQPERTHKTTRAIHVARWTVLEIMEQLAVLLACATEHNGRRSVCRDRP
jgi:hypothetical protein